MNASLFSMSETSDKQLLTLLQQGDQKAFIVIYERHHKPLYVLAYKYLKNKDLAKDAVQQIFLKLWEYHTALTINISLRNYLYTMLKNHVLNEIRNHTTVIEKHYQILQESVEYEEELLAKLEEHEMFDQLYTAIERLPEQKRMICLYKIRENLSNQEISDKMQISIPTVKTHYTQAIKILRQHFEKLWAFCLLWIYVSCS